MKIALLADIHSNKYALEKVLDEIGKSDVDLVVFLGDYIFGGTGSNEVIDMIRKFDSKNKIVVKGNIDDLIYSIE